MKRFWSEARAAAVEGGWTVALDGKPIRSPSKRELRLPSAALAEAIAAEWQAQGPEVQPRAMPLCGLANAASDRTGPEVAAAVAAYGTHDLLCYRAESPPALVLRQAQAWDAPLAWATRRYDTTFVVTSGVIAVDQPAPTLARLRAAVEALGPFALAGLYPVVSVTGSLVLGLAVAERAISAQAAWQAGEVDATWQAEQWGNDPLAERPRAERQADLMASARFLELLET